jgi:signal transduction histidine kinase
MTNYALQNRQRAASRQKSRQLILDEFGNALALIMTSSELIQNYYPLLSDQRKQELFFFIESQTTFLRQMIEDVVSYSDPVDADRDPAPLDLESLCRQVIARFDCPQQRIEFACAGSCILRLDEELIYILLSRLLSNAVKFSQHQSNTPIKFKLDCTSSQIEISIQDYGLGIPSEDQQHVIEPFYRGHNVDGFPGVGLGLSLVVHCVEALNGALEIKSAENAGTLVIVRLPVPASV